MGLAILIGVIGCLVWFPSSGFAVQFKIITLTQGSGLNFGSGVSLNSSGVVGTVVRIGSEDEFVLVDKAGNITNLTQSQFIQVGQGAINDLGQAAFVIASIPDFSMDTDVIFFDGSLFQNITNGSFSIQPAGVLHRTVNNSGQIAFGTDNGPVFFDGNQLIDVTAGSGITALGNQPPSLNENGQILFRGELAGRGGAFLFDGTAVITLDTSSKDVHRQMLHHLRENETVREHALRSSAGQRSFEGGS